VSVEIAVPLSFRGLLALVAAVADPAATHITDSPGG